MPEKRKYKRLPIQLTLEVSSLFNQTETIEIGNAEFKVFNISKSGIGFTSNIKIPLGYYFNATITFSGREEIIRTEILENDSYLYGCEFVGLASIYDYLFEQYEEDIEQE